MSSRNGRRFGEAGEARITDAGLIIPPGLDNSASEQDGITVEEWLKRGNKDVTRAELAAFADAYLMTKMKAVMAYVLDKRFAQFRHDVVAAIDGALEEQRQQKWYRRLGRWIATFGHKAPGEGGLTPEQLKALKAEFFAEQARQQKAEQAAKTPPEVAGQAAEAVGRVRDAAEDRGVAATDGPAAPATPPLQLEPPSADASGE